MKSVLLIAAVYQSIMSVKRILFIHTRRAYADSKTLNEDKREKLFLDIQRDANISFLYDVLTAAEISVSMLSRCG